jgi:hypothetical protein
MILLGLVFFEEDFSSLFQPMSILKEQFHPLSYFGPHANIFLRMRSHRKIMNADDNNDYQPLFLKLYLS